MIPFPFLENTRVAVCESIADIYMPTVNELDAGVDITCELTASGLSIPKTTHAAPRTPWTGQLVTSTPIRYEYSSPFLEAFRARQGKTELLWNLALWKTRHFLVVRYGLPWDTDWEDGQDLEVIDFRFGLRSTPPPDEQAVTFTVPLFVRDATDAAVGIGNVILEENGELLLAEDGSHLLWETA